MCTGLEIALLAGSAGLSGTGALLDRREDERAGRRAVDANNRVLSEIMAKNDAIADQSRGRFDTALRSVAPPNFAANQDAATAKRTGTITSGLTAPDVGAINISQSAPDVVRSEFAKRFAEASDFSRGRGEALGKLGGFGDAVFNQGLMNEDARRNIGTDANLAGGNLALLQTLQDLEQVQAFKPRSPLGGVLRGAGSLLASAAGGGTFGAAGAAPRVSSSVPQVIRRPV